MKNFLFAVSCMLSLSCVNALDRLTEADIDKIDNMARKVMNYEDVARFIDVEGICAGNEKFANAFADLRAIAADRGHLINDETTIKIEIRSVEFINADSNPRAYLGRYRNGHAVRYRGMIAYTINGTWGTNVSFSESNNTVTVWKNLSDDLWNIVNRYR